ncbi:hypothetical protein B0H13DRAFT_1896668 [Mycena leptocephala]|nr:hypothetical protein B0H13DRAFT_1896668 [Mycena leptocephala]
MLYAVDSGVFDSLWYFMICYFAQTAVSLLLYGSYYFLERGWQLSQVSGFYINLFLLSLHTLSRRKTAGTKLLIIASCIMVVLGTTQMALDVVVTSAAARLLQQMVHSQILTEQGLTTLPLFESTLPLLATAQNATFGINKWANPLRWFKSNIPFSSSLSTALWGSQKKAIILPALLMLSTLVAGILNSISSNAEMDVRITYSLGAATNLVLTATTAGRILWIRREASHVAPDSTFRGHYNRAIGIILESGAVYFIAAILMVVFVSLNDKIFSIGFGIGFGIGQQLLPSGPSSLPEVLDTTKEQTEEKDVEGI